MAESRLRLGEILVDAGVLQEDRLAMALEIQKKRGLRLGQILLQEGFISEPQLVQALSRRLSIPWVSLEHVDIADELLDLVPAGLAEEFFLIPVYIQTLARNNRTLFVAMNDPTDESALRLVAASAGMPAKPMVAGPSDISAAIYTYYYGQEESAYDTPMIHSSSPPPVPEFPSKPATPEVKPLPPGKPADPDSEPPEMLTDDQLIEEVIEMEKNSKSSQTGSVSIAELSQSSAPPSPVVTGEPVDLSEIEEVGGGEGQQQQVHRQVEKHMFGLGMSKHRGMSLTLLDGTTIEFGGANQKRVRKGDSDKDRLLSTLRAVAAGLAPAEDLPSDRWEQYLAALLDVLFRKHLIFPEEFMRALNRTDSDPKDG